MAYAKERKQNCNRNLEYLTDQIFSNVYDFFTQHNLTVEANAKSYWNRSGQREMLCDGYSGYSAGTIDDDDTITYNLFHEVWCEAEWLARGKHEGWYESVVKQYFGKDYKALIV